MAPIRDVPELRDLDEQECRSLLQTASFGRIAVTERALPTIVPVLFTLQEDTVVAISPARSPALAASGGAIVTLEIDSYDPATKEGWCVTVLGPATLVSDPAGMEALDSLDIAPWTASHRHYIRIAMARVAGRRLVTTSSSTIGADDDAGRSEPDGEERPPQLGPDSDVPDQPTDGADVFQGGNAGAARTGTPADRSPEWVDLGQVSEHLPVRERSTVVEGQPGTTDRG